MSYGIANKEEFMELQQKLMDHNKVKHSTDGRIQLNERAKRRDELTLQELSQMGTNVRTYSSVGRMFILTPKDDISKEIKGRLQRINGELEGLNKQKTYTDNKIKETEQAVKELMILNAAKGGK